MDPVGIHLRKLIAFSGSIMDGKVLAQVLRWYDGDKLELEQADGTRRDISDWIGLVDLPLTGRWAKQYPDAQFYVELDSITEQ